MSIEEEVTAPFEQRDDEASFDQRVQPSPSGNWESGNTKAPSSPRSEFH